MILRRIPEHCSDRQIEASLVTAFLQQKGFLCDALTPELKRAVSNSVPEICSMLDEAEPVLTLKLIENVFEALIDEREKRENGIVFTPGYIADYIIKNTIDCLPGRISRVIDPACGSGSFLVLAAEYMARQCGRPVCEIISESIFGLEISKDNLHRTKELLALLALSWGEDPTSIRFHIKSADSLRTDWGRLFQTPDFDYVIGNPPYVNTHDMPKDTAKYLKESYTTTQKGVFNLFYAFVEKSMTHLAAHGALGFIVPNNYFTITAAEGLRRYLADNGYLSKIIDFGENMVFSPVRTYNSLLFLTKRRNKAFLYAAMEKTDNMEESLKALPLLSMPVDKLDPAGWKLLTEAERENIQRIESAGTPIKPYIRVGIATLRDNIYIVDGFDPERGMYYKRFEGERYWIEPGITRDIYKVSEIRTERGLSDAKQHIIFPYEDAGGQAPGAPAAYRVMDEPSLSEKYPHCYQYLCRCRPILDKRDKGKENPAAWYAYGRTQGLGNVRRKLLFPTFSLHPKFMLEESRTSLFCNGYAIMESDVYKLEVLQKILNSKVMDYYISKTSYAIEGNYKCYQKKYIQRFSIPVLTEPEIEYLDGESNTSAIDDFLVERYGLELL